MIDRSSPIPVTRQAALLGLSRASLYYKPRRRTAPADREVLERVAALLEAQPGIGSRALCRALLAAGIVVGRARMLDIMRYLSS